MATLNAALTQLNQALELLEAAAVRRAEADKRIAALERELEAVLAERAKLAEQLKAVKSKPKAQAPEQGQLDLIERKIDGAINNIESVLAGRSNAA